MRRMQQCSPSWRGHMAMAMPMGEGVGGWSSHMRAAAPRAAHAHAIRIGTGHAVPSVRAGRETGRVAWEVPCDGMQGSRVQGAGHTHQGRLRRSSAGCRTDASGSRWSMQQVCVCSSPMHEEYVCACSMLATHAEYVSTPRAQTQRTQRMHLRVVRPRSSLQGTLVGVLGQRGRHQLEHTRRTAMDKGR
jgi:hypothetical protein